MRGGGREPDPAPGTAVSASPRCRSQAMSIVNAREIMVEAAKGKYAIGAFNVTNLVQMEGVVDAAVEKKAPVIIQTSVKPAKFLGADVLVAVYRTIAQTAPVPICLHLD